MVTRVQGLEFRVEYVMRDNGYLSSWIVGGLPAGIGCTSSYFLRRLSMLRTWVEGLGFRA
jgi:hypothetical protein